MLSTISARSATVADIPFLARIEYEASLPPLNQCFWELLLQDSETSALQLIEAILRAEAGNWGNVADFLVLEEQGQPVAAAAGYIPNPEDYCPLRISKLDLIAEDLNWSTEFTATFRKRYEQFWGGDCRPTFLTPQAPWIIENVAVLPEARGRGFGKMLLKAMIETGQSQQHSHAGIMVINGNNLAGRLYESLGFKPYETFHAAYFSERFGLEFPGVTKFGLRLNSAGA